LQLFALKSALSDLHVKYLVMDEIYLVFFNVSWHFNSMHFVSIERKSNLHRT